MSDDTNKPGRIGVHGMNAGSGRTRFPPLPPSTGRFRVFVSDSGNVATEFWQLTGYGADERREQELTYGRALDGSYATRDEAIEAWQQGIRRFSRLGYGHLFGILVELTDDESEGRATWLT